MKKGERVPVNPDRAEWPEKVYGCSTAGIREILNWQQSTPNVEYIRADIVAARERELNSKISDLEILLDNCKVSSQYSEYCWEAEKIEIIRATQVYINEELQAEGVSVCIAFDPATILSGMGKK